MPGVRAAARNFAFRHVGGTAAVLIYHRVADLARDPQRLAVSRAHFAEHVAALAESYEVVPLAELIADVRRRRLPKRAVAVTFDDGYADNLENAAPVLTAATVPATVFVSSGYVDTGREFWWDEAERLVLSPGVLPERIELSAGDAWFRARLGQYAEYPQAQAEADAGWDVTQPVSNGRQSLYSDLCNFMRPLAPSARGSVLAQLQQLVGDDGHTRPSHRPLDAAEVARLDALDMVEVGGHTLDHPMLSALSAEWQQVEIDADKRALEAICGRGLRTFSYPYGGLDAYDEASVALVREAGYEGACANHEGMVKPWTDPYRLPRLSVGDWDGARFSAWLKGWFDEPR